MKTDERFAELRRRKIGLNLKARLTLLVGAVVIVSMLIAFGIALILQWLIPSIIRIPMFFQLTVFSLAVAMTATRLLSRIFFDPIGELREGLRRIADGDFSTRLETKTSSTEIQELFAGFNMMASELSATEILQSDFVSNVSHEFKTPIGAIEGYATLLQCPENSKEDELEYIEKILFNTGRLSDLVGNILLLSKIENQSIQTNQTRFSLDEQIRQSILSLEPSWAEKDTVFDIELESVDYTGNKPLLHHVWDNLIGNAIKFGPKGGTVGIRLKAEGDSIIFYVEDDGPGLSAEAEKHLFDKFYQADNSHKSEGNGLGLTLVKRIIAIAGGQVTAENKKDGGARFTVILKNQ